MKKCNNSKSFQLDYISVPIVYLVCYGHHLTIKTNNAIQKHQNASNYCPFSFQKINGQTTLFFGQKMFVITAWFRLIKTVTQGPFIFRQTSFMEGSLSSYGTLLSKQLIAFFYSGSKKLQKKLWALHSQYQNASSQAGIRWKKFRILDVTPKITRAS